MMRLIELIVNWCHSSMLLHSKSRFTINEDAFTNMRETGILKLL